MFNLKKNFNTILFLLLIVIVVVCFFINFKGQERTLEEVVEGFEDKKDNNDETNNNDENANTDEKDNCQQEQNQWFEILPIKSIVSRFSGVSFNVCSVDSDNCNEGNLESKYYVSIDNPNNDTPEGVITVLENGTYYTEVKSNIEPQFWKIIRIDENNKLKKYLPENTMTEEEINNEKYPYYICVKTPVYENSGKITPPNLNKVLQYENGSLSVRFLGNYESQKWYINKKEIKNLPILTVNNYQQSQFSPELSRQGDNQQRLNSLNESNSRNVMSSLKQILKILEKQGNAGQPSESLFGNKPLSVNVNLGGRNILPGQNKEQVDEQLEQVDEQLEQVDEQLEQNVSEDDIVEKFQDDNRDVRTMLNEYERNGIIEEEKKTLRKIVEDSKSDSIKCKIPNFDDYVTVGQMAVCNGCSNL